MIQVIIFSPPYANSVSTENSANRANRLIKAGHDPKEFVGGNARVADMEFNYSKDKNNIGNLDYNSRGGFCD